MRSRADAAPAFLYVPDLGERGAALELSPEESHYVARVCRAHAGDRVTVTDGRGATAELRLTGVGARVTGTIESRDQRARARRVWVWCGEPEGDRADWLVEKLAELGVESWQPIESRRGAWARAERRIERWRRLAVAGLRQSRRSYLMDVRAPIRLDHALRELPDGSDRWLASPVGEHRPGPDPGRLQIGVIGPSSGFSDQEAASLEASGFLPISLGDGRLRTETAALAWTVWATV